VTAPERPGAAGGRRARRVSQHTVTPHCRAGCLRESSSLQVLLAKVASTDADTQQVVQSTVPIRVGRSPIRVVGIPLALALSSTVTLDRTAKVSISWCSAYVPAAVKRARFQRLAVGNGIRRHRHRGRTERLCQPNAQPGQRRLDRRPDEDRLARWAGDVGCRRVNQSLGPGRQSRSLSPTGPVALPPSGHHPPSAPDGH
jgi:hypothetical protein